MEKMMAIARRAPRQEPPQRAPQPGLLRRGRMGSDTDTDPSSFDCQAAFCEEADGFDVGSVLFWEDAGGEGFGGITFEDGDAALEDDGASVVLFVYEMDRAAGDLHAAGQDRLVDVET